MPLITDSASLAALCSRLATADFVTVDTEFLRETTYYPLLCVAQIASPDEAFVIDALAPGTRRIVAHPGAHGKITTLT